MKKVFVRGILVFLCVIGVCTAEADWNMRADYDAETFTFRLFAFSNGNHASKETPADGQYLKFSDPNNGNRHCFFVTDLAGHELSTSTNFVGRISKFKFIADNDRTGSQYLHFADYQSKLSQNFDDDVEITLESANDVPQRFTWVNAFSGSEPWFKKNAIVRVQPGATLGFPNYLTWNTYVLCAPKSGIRLRGSRIEDLYEQYRHAAVMGSGSFVNQETKRFLADPLETVLSNITYNTSTHTGPRVQFSGKIVAEAGGPCVSRVDMQQLYLIGDTEFEAEAGTELEVNTPLVSRVSECALVKSGAGVVSINADVRHNGPLLVKAGTLRIGRGASVTCNSLFVSDEARIEVDENAVFRCTDYAGDSATFRFLKTAEFFIRPTAAVGSEDYLAQSNAGTVGGSFKALQWGSPHWGAGLYHPDLPVWDNRNCARATVDFRQIGNRMTLVRVSARTRRENWSLGQDRVTLSLLNTNNTDAVGLWTSVRVDDKKVTRRLMIGTDTDRRGVSQVTKTYDLDTTVMVSDKDVLYNPTLYKTNFAMEVISIEGLPDGTLPVTHELWDETGLVDVQTTTAAVKTTSFDFNYFVTGGLVDHKTLTTGSSVASTYAVGDFVVFFRALDPGELTAVRRALMARWFGAAEKVPSSVNVTTPEDAVSGTVFLDGCDNNIVKTGPGVLAVSNVGQMTSGKLTVREGGIAARAGTVGCGPELWMDVSDGTACQNGQIVNKGKLAGPFVRSDASEKAIEMTTEFSDGLPLQMIKLTGAQAFTHPGYTLAGTQTNNLVSVFAVFANPRDGIQWTRLFEFKPVGMSLDWQMINFCYVGDGTYSVKTPSFIGSYNGGWNDTSAASFGKPVILVWRDTPNFTLAGIHRKADEQNYFVTNCVREADHLTHRVCEKLTIGGSTIGTPCWNGGLGEFIVFNNNLTSDDACAVLKYLREKWFEGTNPEPPEVLRGGAFSAENEPGELTFESGRILDRGTSVTAGALSVAPGAAPTVSVDARYVDSGSGRTDHVLVTSLSGGESSRDAPFTMDAASARRWRPALYEGSLILQRFEDRLLLILR